MPQMLIDFGCREPVTVISDQQVIDFYFNLRRCISEDAVLSADELWPNIIEILSRSRSIMVPLTKGHHSLIDSEDFDLVAEYTWGYLQNPNQTSFYAKASIGKQQHSLRKQQNPLAKNELLMHQLVISPHLVFNPNSLGILPERIVVDHINGNGLDNRKINLHPVPQFYNSLKKRLVAIQKCGFYWFAFLPIRDTNLLQKLPAFISPNGAKIINKSNLKNVLEFGPLRSEEAAYAIYRRAYEIIYTTPKYAQIIYPD